MPDKFKLVPNDDRAKKQLSAIHRLMARDDVDQVDQRLRRRARGRADLRLRLRDGQEEEAGAAAMALLDDAAAPSRTPSRRLRPGEEMEPLEAAARSRSEADWVVGMNATRAASIRLRAAFDGAVSLGRVQTPTLALVARREEEIRAFKPEPYWLVEATFAAEGERLYSGRYMGGKRIAEDEAAKIVEEAKGRRGAITKLREEGGVRAGPAPLRPHLPPAPRQHAATASRRAARCPRRRSCTRSTRRSPTRAPTRASSPATWSAEIKPIAELVGHNPQYRKASEYVTRARQAAAGARGQRREGRGPPRDHPHELRARPVEAWARTS